MSRYSFLALALMVVAGCAPSASTSSGDFTDVNARYQGNVSEIYGMVLTPTTSWQGIDVKWKDSTGEVRSLSGYEGKVILLSFWRTVPAICAAQVPTLDSVQSDMGDSVRIVSIAEPNVTNKYAGILAYVTSNKVRQQVVIDTLDRVHPQYLVQGSLGWPQTFVVRPTGQVMTRLDGYETLKGLDSLVRVAYR